MDWHKSIRDILLAVLTTAIIGAGAGLWTANETLTRMELLVNQHEGDNIAYGIRIRELERHQDRTR